MTMNDLVLQVERFFLREWSKNLTATKECSIEDGTSTDARLEWFQLDFLIFTVQY